MDNEETLSLLLRAQAWRPKWWQVVAAALIGVGVPLLVWSLT